MPPAVAPACHARALLAGGRGLLDLAPPDPDLHAVLRRAGVDATGEHCRGLRALALATPGLDRVISGVLVGPSELRAVAARHALRVGIRMVGNVADGLDASIARHAADGATFACRQVLVGHGSRSAALRDAAAWVAACQRGGLVPLLDCTAPTWPRHGLASPRRRTPRRSPRWLPSCAGPASVPSSPEVAPARSTPPRTSPSRPCGACARPGRATSRGWCSSPGGATAG